MVSRYKYIISVVPRHPVTCQGMPASMPDAPLPLQSVLTASLSSPQPQQVRFSQTFMVFDFDQFSHQSAWHHNFNLDRQWWRHSQLKPIWPHSQYLAYSKCQHRFLKVDIEVTKWLLNLYLAPVLDETTQAQLVLRNLAEIGKRIPDLAAILNPTLPPGLYYLYNCRPFVSSTSIAPHFSDTAKNPFSCTCAFIATTSFDNSSTTSGYGPSINESQIE